MRPWLKWLIWINPVQYTFEAIVSNEFYKLELECVPPFIVPDGPGALPGHQSCLTQGSRPGQTTVRGADYILTNFGYTRDHLWRNFGIVAAWFILFVAVSMLGAELQASPKRAGYGGAAATIYMRNQVPSSMKRDIANAKTGGNQDEEKGYQNHAASSPSSSEPRTSVDEKEARGSISQSSAALTWQNVNYTIPYKGGQKKLLQDIEGYVKPGRLTALVGASGAGFVCFRL
jgi:hypothetical protein